MPLSCGLGGPQVCWALAPLSESGETGRRTGFRIQRAKALGGSTPPSRTNIVAELRNTIPDSLLFPASLCPEMCPESSRRCAAGVAPERGAHVIVRDDFGSAETR